MRERQLAFYKVYWIRIVDFTICHSFAIIMPKMKNFVFSIKKR
jgi:hypothetical protein